MKNIKFQKSIIQNINFKNQNFKKRLGLSLFEKKSNVIKDNISISSEGEKFSKKAILALIDNSVHTKASELSFYLENYNNSSKILDAINFGAQVECGYNPDFKDYGILSFNYQSQKQIIPIYAIPKINTNLLNRIYTENNSLKIENKNYVSFTAINGKKYPWTVMDGKIGWAESESLISEPFGQKNSNFKWEMRKASNILTSLAQGKCAMTFKNEDIKKALSSVGIKEGHFKIDAGAGTHRYILQNNGNVLSVDDKINFLTTTNWFKEGYKENDVFEVYGNKYKVNIEGKIEISENDVLTSTDIIYPSKPKF